MLNWIGPAKLVLRSPDGSLDDALAMVDILSMLGIRGHIAGGFLRDLHHRVEPKDIDIFISGDVDKQRVKTVFETAGYAGTTVVQPQLCEYLSFCDVQYVMEFTKTGARPIQVIVLKEGMRFEDIINRLDLGLCQIGIDGVGDLYYSDAYWQDEMAQTFTIIRKEHPRDILRSTKRYNRIAQRYPGWALVGGTMDG